MRKELKQWFAAASGRRLLELEQEIIDENLSNLFGYHLLQIGSAGDKPLYANSRISHKRLIYLQDEIPLPGGIHCRAESLSIAADSIDVVLLPHVLEFSDNPHKLLRETERILIGEGHVIISVFNPWSLCGLWRLFLAWRDIPPWNGCFYSFRRIRDWLTLLDLELIRVDHCFYTPPVQREELLSRLAFLERAGGYCWPLLAGARIFTARKRVLPLTPVKIDLRQRRRALASGLAEPAPRMRIADD